MTMLATVDPWDVEDGAVINPAPGRPGIVVAHDIDDHGDETYQLGDGRTYWHAHGVPMTVILTQDVRANQIKVGDLIAERGAVVRVVRIRDLLGALTIRWRSDARRPDGIPVVSGITAVRPAEMATTRIRLIDRPADLAGVDW